MNVVRITSENIDRWPRFKKLLEEEKIKFDSTGRLRYLHGAPVGDLIATDDGSYKESAEEWFEVGSQKANEFIWP